MTTALQTRLSRYHGSSPQRHSDCSEFKTHHRHRVQTTRSPANSAEKGSRRSSGSDSRIPKSAASSFRLHLQTGVGGEGRVEQARRPGSHWGFRMASGQLLVIGHGRQGADMDWARLPVGPSLGIGERLPGPAQPRGLGSVPTTLDYATTKPPTHHSGISLPSKGSVALRLCGTAASRPPSTASLSILRRA